MTSIRSRMLIAVAGAVLLAGCGTATIASSSVSAGVTTPVGPTTTTSPSPTATSIPTTSTSTTVPTTTTTTAAPVRSVNACHASQLSVSLYEGSWYGLAQSQEFQPVEFANTAGTACYLQGAPTLAFSYQGVPLTNLGFLGLSGSVAATVNPPGLSYVNGQPDPNTPALDPAKPPEVVLAPGRHAMVVLTEGSGTTGAMSTTCPGFEAPARTIAFTLPGSAGTVTATNALYFQCPHNNYSVSWFTSLSALPSSITAFAHNRSGFHTPPQTSTPN